ncbi:hypothetical protein [Fluviispira sanaruensis]|uniref:Uncharacterized protein n=1 Tax=Fluviispira sanaruensis TaxID=2493639 RepID=A0A4P2VJK0_FLUSA|nr:hypothetical protein [Fluviispira sanaruensis]BBH53346.1 hypothetical protein JCM31447_17890 [Fluviispira sanaruensis]
MKNSTSDLLQNELISILKMLNRSDLRMVNLPLYYKILEKFVNLLDVATTAQEADDLRKSKLENMFENQVEQEQKDSSEGELQNIKPTGLYH